MGGAGLPAAGGVEGAGGRAALFPVAHDHLNSDPAVAAGRTCLSSDTEMGFCGRVSTSNQHWILKVTSDLA